MASNRVSDLPDHWVVLSVGGGKVVETETEFLARDWEAWTPKMWTRQRLPRRKARRLVAKPLLPGYIFIRCTAFESYIMNSEAFPNVRRIMMEGEDMRVRDDQLDELRKQDLVESARDGADGELVLALHDPGDKVKLDLPALGIQRGVVVQRLNDHRYEIRLTGNNCKVAVPHFLIDKEDD